MPRSRRSFTPDFKAQVVLQLLRGEPSQAELCRKHSLTPQLLAHWKAHALEQLHTLFEAEDARRDRDHERIAELEQLLGQQTYELDILKKASRRLHGPPTKNGRSS